MKKNTVFGLEEILAILPHRPPFLFVDRITRFIPDKIIVAERQIKEDEPWFKGHFPQKAIMPGVLILDALAQTSGLLMGFSQKASAAEKKPLSTIFYLASSQIKFITPAYPGETLELIANQDKQFSALYSYTVEALAGRKTVAKGSLTLAQTSAKI